MGFFAQSPWLMSKVNGNFIGVNWENLLTSKNTECKRAALQMLNDNYGNEHLLWQKPQHHAPGGCVRPIPTLDGNFQLPSPSLNGLGDKIPQWERTGASEFPRRQWDPRAPATSVHVWWQFTISLFTIGSQEHACSGSCWGRWGNAF